MLAIVNPNCWPFDKKEARDWREETHELRRSWVPAKREPRCWRVHDRQATAPSLARIVGAIDDARGLTDLPVDWDDEGASPIAEQTFQRAASFLRTTAMQLAVWGIELPAPQISPCSDGSIDLFWKDEAFRLLVNVQPGNAASDFFGENPRGIQVKGPFVPENHDVSYFRWLFEP